MKTTFILAGLLGSTLIGAAQSTQTMSAPPTPAKEYTFNIDVVSEVTKNPRFGLSYEALRMGPAAERHPQWRVNALAVTNRDYETLFFGANLQRRVFAAGDGGLYFGYGWTADFANLFEPKNQRSSWQATFSLRV